MKMLNHEKLIEELSLSIRPVRRLLPVGWRTLLYAALALGFGWLATRLLLPIPLSWAAPSLLMLTVNAVLCVVVGGLGLSWAFSLSVPGAVSGVKGWLLMAFAVWLSWVLLHLRTVPGVVDGIPGRYCFQFVLVAGLPMLGLVIYALRRARCLYPTPALAVAGGAVGFLAFALLGLCHPVALDLADFAMHLAAAAMLMGITLLAGRWVLAP